MSVELAINLWATYVMATGSEDTISRTFSKPNVVIYAIEYHSCQRGIASIFTSTVNENIIRKNMYAICKQYKQ